MNAIVVMNLYDLMCSIVLIFHVCIWLFCSTLLIDYLLLVLQELQLVSYLLEQLLC